MANSRVLRAGLLGVAAVALCAGALCAGAAAHRPKDAQSEPKEAQSGPEEAQPGRPKPEARHPIALSDIPPPEAACDLEAKAPGQKDREEAGKPCPPDQARPEHQPPEPEAKPEPSRR